METYDAQAIELKWQETWEREGAFRVSNDPVQPKSYVLVGGGHAARRVIPRHAPLPDGAAPAVAGRGVPATAPSPDAPIRGPAQAANSGAAPSAPASA